MIGGLIDYRRSEGLSPVLEDGCRLHLRGDRGPVFTVSKRKRQRCFVDDLLPVIGMTLSDCEGDRPSALYLFHTTIGMGVRHAG